MRSGSLSARLARVEERQRRALVEELRAKMAAMPDTEIARLVSYARRGDQDGSTAVFEQWGVTQELAVRLEVLADEAHPLEEMFAAAFADVFRRSKQINACIAQLEAERG